MMYIEYMKDKKVVRKNIDLTEECVKILSKEAIDKNTVFKLYVQNVLEGIAKKNKK